MKFFKNKKKIVNAAIIIASSIIVFSCHKKEVGESGPAPYLGGRVVLINSDTPVPNAVVRFAKFANTCLTCPMVYVDLGNDTTDENGHFEIPAGTGATMAIAFGLDSIFNHESQAGDMDAYWLHGGEMKLQLIPPAWVKVSAVDIEPLNPEVLYVFADATIGQGGGEVNLATPRVWRVDGNVSQNLSYWFLFEGNTSSEVKHYQVNPLAFDTTEYIITY